MILNSAKMLPNNISYVIYYISYILYAYDKNDDIRAIYFRITKIEVQFKH